MFTFPRAHFVRISGAQAKVLDCLQRMERRPSVSPKDPVPVSLPPYGRSRQLETGRPKDITRRVKLMSYSAKDEF